MASGREGRRELSLIDLLVTDRLEALRLTFTQSTEEAVRQFKAWGVKACMVTDGAKPTAVWASSGGIWKARELEFLPVSSYVSDLHGSYDGDTTGCGDNFLGGATASLAFQRDSGSSYLDIDQVYRMASASGAFACTYHGGAYREKEEGEKRSIVEKSLNAMHHEGG